MNELLQPPCKDNVSLNFSNAVISDIKQDFISSPIITCLNLMGNNIQNIGRGAFNKLPNLTQLFLSNNKFHYTNQFLNFRGRDKLQVLIMDSATNVYLHDCKNMNYHKVLNIFDEYPNLEMLSLRKNCFDDLRFVKKTPFSDSVYTLAYTTALTLTQRIPFPKLKILDLSGNSIKGTNFVELLPNSLHFLDLHDNYLDSLNLNKNINKLFALNLDNNRFYNIINSYNGSGLSVINLKDLHYLSISTNNINIIDSGAFQDNNKLLYLNLSHNQINYVYPKTFANLKNLKTLDLSNNKLLNVPEISNEIKISTLYINRNNIKRIISHTFTEMPKLTKLLIGGNQIDEIDVDAFVYLSALEELDLSENKLNFLPEGWTEFLVSLKYLDLSDNKFTSLESLSLTNTLPLIEMYLRNNLLEYLNVGYFENLPQNLTISMKSNLVLQNEYKKYEDDFSLIKIKC